MNQALLRELARAFDAGFEQEPNVQRFEQESVLDVRVGDETCTLRCRELVALTRDCMITALPGARPEVLGLTGFRGQLVPVLSLAHCLGLIGTETPRWLALIETRQGERVAFAFDALVRHLSTPSGANEVLSLHEIGHQLLAEEQPGT